MGLCFVGRRRLSRTYRRNRPRRVGGIKMSHACIPLFSNFDEDTQIPRNGRGILKNNEPFRESLRALHQNQYDTKPSSLINRQKIPTYFEEHLVKFGAWSGAKMCK